MLYSLENDDLCVQVRSHGAELRSIKERADETEYLWGGDAKWWKYSSPVLFPIVGKLLDGKYRVDGKEYVLPGHGLGRISEFELVERAKDKIKFALKWTEESLKSYPWKFELDITYTLVGKSVQIQWDVKNLDDKEMIFSIGSHSAFCCPRNADEEFSDYYFEFSEKEDVKRLLLDEKGQFRRDCEERLTGDQLSLSYEIFKEDALAYGGLKSDTVKLRSKKNDKCVTVTAKNFPYWGFWTPAQGGAPFVCIEPWLGHTDYVDFHGEFKDREGSHALAAGETFTAGYSITVG